MMELTHFCKDRNMAENNNRRENSSTGTELTGELTVALITTGWMPLHHAAETGEFELVKRLLDHGHPVDVCNMDGRTPLMLAAENGHRDCVEILLRSGADPIFNCPDGSDDFHTALHSSIMQDHLDCLELVASKTNLEFFIMACHPGPNADTYSMAKKKACSHYTNLVSFAIEHKSYKCLKFLLDRGFSPDSLILCNDLSVGLLSPVDLGCLEPAISFAVSKEDSKAMSILHDAGAMCDTSPVHRCSCIHPIVRALDLSSPDMLNTLFELYGNNFGQKYFEWHEVFLGSVVKTNRIKNLLMHGYNPENYLGCDLPFTVFRFASFVMTNQLSLVKKLELILEFVVMNTLIQTECLAVIEIWKSLACFDESLWQSVISKISKPSLLTHICRMTVRHHLYTVHGPGFVRLLSSLPLPPKLRDFMSFAKIARDNVN